MQPVSCLSGAAPMGLELPSGPADPKSVHGRYEPAKGDERLDALPRAVALDDAQDGIFAQPDPVAYFAIRLAFGDES